MKETQESHQYAEIRIDAEEVNLRLHNQKQMFIRMLEEERKERMAAPFKSLGIEKDIEFADIRILNHDEGKVIMQSDEGKEKEIKRKFLEQSEVAKSILNIPAKLKDIENEEIGIKDFKEDREQDSFHAVEDDRDNSEEEYLNETAHNHTDTDIALVLDYESAPNSGGIQEIELDKLDEIEKDRKDERTRVEKTDLKAHASIERQSVTQLKTEIKVELAQSRNSSPSDKPVLNTEDSKKNELSAKFERKDDDLSRVQSSNLESHDPKVIETAQLHAQTLQNLIPVKILESTENPLEHKDKSISPETDIQLMNSSNSLQQQIEQENTKLFIPNISKSESSSPSLNTSQNNHKILSNSEDSIKNKTVKNLPSDKITTIQDPVHTHSLNSDPKLNSKHQGSSSVVPARDKSNENYDKSYKDSTQKYDPDLGDSKYTIEISLIQLPNQLQDIDKDKSIVIQISSDKTIEKSAIKSSFRTEDFKETLLQKTHPSLKSPQSRSDIKPKAHTTNQNQLSVPSPISSLVHSTQSKNLTNLTEIASKPMLEETYFKSMNHLEKTLQSSTDQLMINRKSSVNTPHNYSKPTKLARNINTPLSQSSKLDFPSPHNSHSQLKLPHIHSNGQLTSYEKPVINSRNLNSGKTTERQVLTKDLSSKLIMFNPTISKGPESGARKFKPTAQSKSHSKIHTLIPNPTIEASNLSGLYSRSNSFIKDDLRLKSRDSKSKINFVSNSTPKSSKHSKAVNEVNKPKQIKKRKSSMKHWVYLQNNFIPTPCTPSPRQIVLVYPAIKVTTSNDLNKAYGINMQTIKKKVISIPNI